MADNEIELIGTALANFDRVAAGLSLLEKNYKGVLYDVETSIGMDHAKAARAAIREPRYEVERLRKGAKAPILALGKRLDAEATRITNALLTLETPIDEQIKAEEDRKEQEEDRKEQEKIAQAAKESARVTAIQNLIEGIRQWPAKAVGKPSSVVALMVATANEYQITEVFQERSEEATGVLETAKASLAGILSDRLAQEADQARIIAEREELTRLRTEQAERDRIAREAMAAENAKQAEILRKERAENDRIARERQDELNRQAETQRQAQAVEAGRIAAERAEFERQQETARKASEAKKPRKAVQNPGREAIAAVVAEHYSVEGHVARQWLKEIDWEPLNAY